VYYRIHSQASRYAKQNSCSAKSMH